MASEKTKLKYRQRGMAYAAQARKRYPESSPLDALCRHAEDRTVVLTARTVRVYRRQYVAAIFLIGRATDRSNEEIATAIRRVVPALERLKGRPAEPRTSSKKVKDPPDWMVKEIFGHLKITALRYRRIRRVACALYCLLAPKLGTRPVELVGAEFDGDTLLVPSAKQAQGQQRVRCIDISEFHPTHKEALLALIYIVEREVSTEGYDAWLKILAETLARACEAVAKKIGQDIPRLAPSAFRHTAISTWHAAGYTAEEIAELVGHRSLRSQNAYKRSSSAWPLTTPLAKPTKVLTASVMPVAIPASEIPLPTDGQEEPGNPTPPYGL